MKGTVYGVGVGPGDPEYMTLKAVRLIRENEVIAVPGRDPRTAAAYRIALAAVPELADKTLLGIDMPMIRDREKLHEYHVRGARQIEAYLDKGQNVVFLTLGDSTLYCTFSYLQHILENDGCPVQLVSGITSVTAAAAALNRPLAEWDELIHIVPAAHKSSEPLTWPGTCVLMKSASHMKEVKERLRESGKRAEAVENCGMADQKLYRSVDEIPDEAGYFSLIIAKD